MKRYCLYVVLLFSSLSVVGQNFWNRNPIGLSGNITDMISYFNTIWVSTDQNGIWRSFDAGITWQQANTSGELRITDLEFDPAAIYATTAAPSANRLLRSTDFGATFIPVDASLIIPTSGYFSYVKRLPSGKILLAPNNVLLSPDQPGAPQISNEPDFSFTSSLTFSLTDYRIGNVDLEVGNNGVIYWILGNMIMRSDDEGATVSTLATLGPDITYLTDFEFSGGKILAINGIGQIFYSADLGANWTTIISPVTGQAHVKFGPNGDIVCLSRALQKIYISSNLGNTWTTLDGRLDYTTTPGSYGPLGYDQFDTWPGYRAMGFVFNSSTDWVAANSTGVYRTTAAGTAWVPGVKFFEYADVFVSSSNYVYVAAKGVKGVAVADLSIYINAAFGLNAFNIGSNYSNNRLVSAFAEANGAVYAYSPLAPGLMRTTNNGTNWTVPNNSQTLLNLVSNSGKLYSINANNLLTSADGGATWPSAALTGFTGTATKVMASKTANIIFVQNDANQLFRIDVTSAQATQVLTGVLDFAVGDNALFALTSTTNVRRSLDNGTTFTSRAIASSFACDKIWAFNEDAIVTRPADPAVKRMNLSNNSGVIWSQQDLLDNTLNVSLVDVDFSPAGFAFAAVNNSFIQSSKGPVVTPKAPSNLRIATTNINSFNADVQIVFDDNANNESYTQIDRSEDNVTWTKISTDRINITPIGFLTDGGLTHGKQYYYRARAVNAAGASAYSNIATTTIPAFCGVSTIPDNRSWSGTSTADPGFTASTAGPFTNPNVAVQQVTGSISFFVLDQFRFGIVPLSSGTSPTMTIQENCTKIGVAGGSNINGNGPGIWDPVAKTLTMKWMIYPAPNTAKFEATTVLILNPTDPAPVKPTLKASIYSASEVLLAWTTNPYETEYLIERSSATNPNWVTAATVNRPLTSYIDKNLQPDVYYYRMTARHYKGAANAMVSSILSDEDVAQLTTINGDAITTRFRPFETDLNQNLDITQGASWGDLDGDGDEDLVLATFRTAQGFQNQPPSIYENTGNGQLVRKTVTTSLPLVNPDVNTVIRGAGIMDFNNDGKIDVYLNKAGTANDQVMINKGGWTFDILNVNENSSPSIRENMSFSDIDKDGFVDFLIGTESRLNSTTPVTAKPSLMQNAAGVGFTQITEGELVNDLMDSRSLSFADYDNDGDQDVFVINNGQDFIDPFVNNGWIGKSRHYLYRNNGDKTFTRLTGLIFDTNQEAFDNARTISWGDVDNDGDLDLFVGSNAYVLGNNNVKDRLYINDMSGSGNFISRVATSSISADLGTETFSSAFGDIDNDGDLDLLVANGASRFAFSAVVKQNVIFQNDGLGTFSKVQTAELFTSEFLSSIGLALADVDKDGFLDVFVGKGSDPLINNTLPNLLFKSTLTPDNTRRWLQVKLTGSVSNRAAIGARVTVVTTSPARSQIREVSGLTGYSSQNSLIQHFGLGSAATCTVTVRWPSGITQTLTGVAANQIISITEDNTGPAMVSLTPANASTGIAFATPLEITFNEPPIRVTGKKIRLFKASDLVVPVQTFDAFEGVVTGNKVTFTPTLALTSYTQYKVTIEDGAFRDIYTNLGVYNQLVWEFTTLDTTVPVISAVNSTAILPKGFGTRLFTAGASDNVSVASVTLSYKGAGASGNFIDLAGTFNTTTQLWEFNVLESFYNTTGLEFYVTAKDPDNNVATFPATGVLQSLFETTAPVLTVPTNPVLISRGFTSRSFSVTATDNFGVATVTMSHRNTKNGTTYTDLAGTLNATVANQYDFTVPESAFNGDGLEYYFSASDATGNSVRSPLSTATPSALKMLIDQQAPTFSAFAAPTTLAKANTTFTVRVSDNLGVASVVMRYRGISSKTFATSSPGVRNAAGDYDFAVSQDWIDNMGIEYYFRAVDASKNIGVSPDTTAATNKYYKSFVRLDGANVSKLSLIKGSTGASGYQIISVPLELANRNIADNFDELGTADKTAYRFLRYRSTPTPGWDEYPGGGLSLLNRGEGYFLNSLKAEEITLLEGSAPAVDQSNFFQLALKKGWNQIGNPYTVQVQWSDVLAFNNNPAGVGKLVKYDNGYNTNDADGVIDPFKGGFVQVDNDVTLRIPFRGFNTGGRKTVPGSDLGLPNWEVPFTLTQAGLTYEVGMIGMNEEASLSKDNFDLPAVPRLNEYIDMSFDHPEHFMKKFAQDVVPTTQEFTWDFVVASNLTGEATISWKNEMFGNNGKELFLLDVSTQQLTTMRTATSYSFNPSVSKSFRIFFGENLEKRISPTRLSIGRVYPNPTSGATVVSFSLPETQSIMNVSLEVFDMMGRKISTLAKGRMTAGFYTTEWDANTSQVTDGLYICKLMVSSNDKQSVVTEKIIVKR